MWQSLRTSHLLLRLSFAIVFIWFGVEKFLDFGHASASTIMYGVGVVELLIGISLVTNMFIEFFAPVGVAILIVTPFFYGFNEAMIRDISLVGGLLALIFWPSRGFRNY